LTLETATTLWPCGGLCLEEVRDAVFGTVHQNMALGAEVKYAIYECY